MVEQEFLIFFWVSWKVPHGNICSNIWVNELFPSKPKPQNDKLEFLKIIQMNCLQIISRFKFDYWNFIPTYSQLRLTTQNEQFISCYRMLHFYIHYMQTGFPFNYITFVHQAPSSLQLNIKLGNCLVKYHLEFCDDRTLDTLLYIYKSLHVLNKTITS